MTNNPKNPDITYLPQRYKMQIEAKKKRRKLKKIVMFVLVIAICAVLYMVLNGILSGSSSQTQEQHATSTVPSHMSPTPQSGETAIPTTRAWTGTATSDIIIGRAVPAESNADMLSPDAATAYLRLDFPAPEYNLISVNLTDQYSGRQLYEFMIKQFNNSWDDTGFSVFVDAGTGDPYTPGQGGARITAEQAKILVSNAFMAKNPDKIRVRYNNKPDSLQEWRFTLIRDNSTILTGTMDADTGQIVSFAESIEQSGRQANPAIDISAAQKIADHYIIERNGFPLPLNMSVARYDPVGFPGDSVAGQYVFIYNRIMQEIPCDYEGFSISVDSVTGEVTEYNRRWNAPDNAFSLAKDPLVTRYEAAYSILERARQTYPASAGGLALVSAEIRWKDQGSPGSLPRPGSIPIAWKIQFYDDILREREGQIPAVGWVDTETGKILDFYYQH